MRTVYKYDADGNRTEVEKLSPEQLEKDLAALPGDLLTKDIGDEKKIHELDPEHIRSSLTEEYVKEQTEDTPQDERKAVNELWDAPIGRDVPLNKQRVAAARMRVMMNILDTAISIARKDGDAGMAYLTKRRHLWFPDGDNVNCYCCRDGNPPADSDRPKALRGYDLHLDVLNPPKEVLDELKKSGIYLKDAIEELSQTRRTVDIEIG